MKRIFKLVKRLLVLVMLSPLIISGWMLPRKLFNHIMWGVFNVLGNTFGKSDVAVRNLEIAFPNMNDHERQPIIQAMWGFMGRVVADLITLHKWQVGRDIIVHGEQYYLDALKQNKGVIVVTAHLGSWEISSVAVRHYSSDILGVYSRLKNPFFDKLVHKWRSRVVTELLEKDDDATPLRMMRGLRKKNTIIMIADQKFKKGQYIPFFGVPALSPMGAGVFGAKGIPVVPLQIIRGDDGVSFDCIFHPPIESPNTGDNDKDADAIVTEMNEQFTHWISEKPEQYPWIHKRWDDEYYMLNAKKMSDD